MVLPGITSFRDYLSKSFRSKNVQEKRNDYCQRMYDC